MILEEFVSKWQVMSGTERGLAHSHFIDLCTLLDQPAPSSDPTQQQYAFEKAVIKTGGGQGFADVWLKGHFAWEYKRKKRDLNAAYDQLRLYEEALQNPPLLVVCDLDRFEIHTRFNGAVKYVFAFDLEDLRANIPIAARAGDGSAGAALAPLEILRSLFKDPERLRPQRTTAQVTEEVAKEFGKIAALITGPGRRVKPRDAARFLIRIVFCLFAEDTGLLPDNLITDMVKNAQGQGDKFAKRLKSLFNAMSEGGTFGNDEIKYFNGGLFDDDNVVDLKPYELTLLQFASKQDWSNIEPSIFGTLFERSLDPSKRSQLGAHYTSREDILAIVEPVLMTPLRQRWAEVQSEVTPLLEKRDEINAKVVPGVPLTGRNRSAIDAINTQISAKLRSFGQELGTIRVLDPACGSGNFLYVALRQLLDLNKAILAFGTACGVPILEIYVQPEQMRGIEISDYAHELAPVTVWIGYLQWLRENGFGQPSEPILHTMENIVHRDAILSVGDGGTLHEPEWPEADIIIGNPPFLGGKKLRTKFEDIYVDQIFELYDGRVARESDFVCYWFERARVLVESGAVQRAGLLATDSIRGGANRRVLQRIKESGDIFMAWESRNWYLDGASVRTSMVGFDDGTRIDRTLNGEPVTAINANLTGTFDLTAARRLPENVGISFMGDTKGGAFDIPGDIATQMLNEPMNKNGHPNSDVVRPWANGLDVVRRPRGMYIIDFGVNMTQVEAAKYTKPYAYIEGAVKKVRAKSRTTRSQWWLHERPRPDLRSAIAPLSRFIVSVAVAKFRLFTWMNAPTLPDHALFVFAREDDYFFGILHSRAHEIWSLKMGTALEDRPRYTASSTFETFPLPWSPGQETASDPFVVAIADAARSLVAARNAWLNPPKATPAILKKRTLTNLYNNRPDWLVNAHTALDTAVFAAYAEVTGEEWDVNMTAEELLTRLLALNLQRATPSG